MIVPLIIVAAAVCSAGALAYKERDVICDYVEHKLMERRLRKRASAVPASNDRREDDSDSEQTTLAQTHTSQSQVHHLHSAVGSDEPYKDDYTEEIEMSFRRRNIRGTSIGSDKTVESSDPNNSFHMPAPPQADPPQYWSSSSQSSDTSGSATQNRRGGYPRQTYGHGPGHQVRGGGRPASIVSEQPSLSYSANSNGESTWGSSASDISSDYDFADERTSSEGENVFVVDPSAPSLYEYREVNTP